tara:strand:+ start:630 stop:2153 length:1524 start_codon:yes stop_codon:yes gene_type:complete
MKKLNLLVLGILSVSLTNAQDITDALRYSQNEIQGTARFRALSGAFGALGGDMSAVSLNPAGSAVFSKSHASFTLSNLETNSDTKYFNGFNSSSETKFDINQGGLVFVFGNQSSSNPWKKFTLGIAYDKTNNFDDNWFASGTNTNNDNNFSNSIASYFYDYADGVRLGGISLLDGESISQAYSDIGNVFGFGPQQAFLGYQSYILDPVVDDDNNTLYSANISNGDFNQNYSYVATGYNGKMTFNFATQYEDNLYLGINLNSHFINYDRSTSLIETNQNPSLNYINFDNNLSTTGNGFSFQLGGIIKLSPEFRVGVTYDSPTWYTIDEETSQYLATDGEDNGFIEINPQVVNIYPRYRLQTPAKITGSFAYIFGDKGLFSFDYSRKDYSSTKFKPTTDPFFTTQNNIINSDLVSASTYRFGAEIREKQFSFRGGYRFEQSPYKNGLTVGDLNGYSFGIGFNFGNTKLDITYDQAKRKSQNQLYNVGLTDAALIDAKNSNITFSLGFNI